MSDSEISDVLAELERRMGEFRASVNALQAILTTPAPEVAGDQPAATA